MSEDMDFGKIECDVENGKKGNDTMEVVGIQDLFNSSSETQSTEFQAEYSQSTGSAFKHSHTVSLKIGITFQAGVSFIAEGKIETEISASSTVAWGTSVTNGKKFSARFPVVAHPWCKVTATATVKRAKINVPYTMTLSSPSSRCRVVTKGNIRRCPILASSMRGKRGGTPKALTLKICIHGESHYTTISYII